MNRKEANKIIEKHSAAFGALPREAIEAIEYLINVEPCEGVISRQVVKEQMINYGFHAPDMTVTEFVEDILPVTPKPKMGRWINDRCSECGKGIEDLIASPEWYRDEQPNFCPFCGLKLVDSQESGE